MPQDAGQLYLRRHLPLYLISLVHPMAKAQSHKRKQNSIAGECQRR